jgi:hypothetical protein
MRKIILTILFSAGCIFINSCKKIKDTQIQTLLPLLYLKTQVHTNYSQLILEKLDYYKLPVIVDDESENKIQSLSWYLRNVLTVPAVLVEFSQIYRTGHQIHNAKCAFIAGLSPHKVRNMPTAREKG